MLINQIAYSNETDVAEKQAYTMEEYLHCIRRLYLRQPTIIQDIKASRNISQHDSFVYRTDVTLNRILNIFI